MHCGAWQASWLLKSAHRMPGMPQDVKSLPGPGWLVIAQSWFCRTAEEAQCCPAGRASWQKDPRTAGSFPMQDVQVIYVKVVEINGPFWNFILKNCFQSGDSEMPASLQQTLLCPGSEPRFCLLSGHLKSIMKSHGFHTENHKTATPILGWSLKHQT